MCSHHKYQPSGFHCYLSAKMILIVLESTSPAVSLSDCGIKRTAVFTETHSPSVLVQEMRLCQDQRSALCLCTVSVLPDFLKGVKDSLRFPIPTSLLSGLASQKVIKSFSDISSINLHSSSGISTVSSRCPIPGAITGHSFSHIVLQ